MLPDMASIVAVANQKGGCGKTTTTVNLAGALSRIGYKVLVVDADPQASAYTWSPNNGLPFAVKAVPEGALESELPTIAASGKWEFILIDCPPGTRGVTTVAMSASNLALVPLLVSGSDFKATKPFLNIVKEVRASNANLRVLVFINGRHNSRLDREARATAERLFAGVAGVKVLDTEIPHAAMIREVSIAGKTVFDYKPARGTVAEKAYTQLTKEVLQWLKATAGQA